MRGTKSTALITGASSGIGAVYAERLAARDFDLVIVARNVTRLEAVAERIKAKHDVSVTVLPADLTNVADLERVEAVLKSDENISMLVNNAGFGGAGSLLDSELDKMLEMISINTTALTRLTYAAVPGMVSRKHGTIVNIASIVAIAPELLNGVYGGTKAFVLAFSQSLRKELADKGVQVQAVLPGATATEFWDIAGVGTQHLPGEWLMSASDLVDAALVGLDLGEFATIPSLQNGAEWDAYEAARQIMLPHLSNMTPAERYRSATSA